MRFFTLFFVLACLALIAATTLLLVKDNQAKPWPGKYLVIDDKSGREQDLSRAIAKINATGIGIRVIASANNPDVVVRVVDRRQVQSLCQDKDCIGHASAIGYQGGQEEILLSRQFLAKRPEIDDLIIHEIGHILGLSHSENSCRLMGKENILDRCDQAEGWVRCGFQRAEVIQLEGLYGRTGSYDPWCPFFAGNQDRPPTTITTDGREVDNWQSRPVKLLEELPPATGESPALSRSFSRR